MVPCEVPDAHIRFVDRNYVPSIIIIVTNLLSLLLLLPYQRREKMPYWKKNREK